MENKEEKMITHKVVLESSYYGCDEEFEFEMPESATTEEIEEEGFRVLTSKIEWYVE